MALADHVADHVERCGRLRDVANATVSLHQSAPELAYEVLAGSFVALYATFEAAYEVIVGELSRVTADLGPRVLVAAPGASVFVLEPTFRKLIRSEDAHRGLRTEGGAAAERRAAKLKTRLRRRAALFRPAQWEPGPATILRGSPTHLHIVALLEAVATPDRLPGGWEVPLRRLYRRRNDYAHASESPGLDVRLTQPPWGDVVTAFNADASWFEGFIAELADVLDAAVDDLWQAAV